MSASPTDRLDLRLPARPESIPRIRHAVVAFATAHGYEDPGAIALAVTEAATNAVLHAYTAHSEPGEVLAVACAEPDQLVVVVRDWGSGMGPRLDTPGLGLGLPTIATLASSFDVEAAEGAGTLLRMRFMRSAADAA
jgi:anti-sigma regulatory factor (Ser/Thr protein kinase)